MEKKHFSSWTSYFIISLQWMRTLSLCMMFLIYRQHWNTTVQRINMKNNSRNARSFWSFSLFLVHFHWLLLWAEKFGKLFSISLDKHTYFLLANVSMCSTLKLSTRMSYRRFRHTVHFPFDIKAILFCHTEFYILIVLLFAFINAILFIHLLCFIHVVRRHIGFGGEIIYRMCSFVVVVAFILLTEMESERERKVYE